MAHLDWVAFTKLRSLRWRNISTDRAEYRFRNFACKSEDTVSTNSGCIPHYELCSLLYSWSFSIIRGNYPKWHRLAGRLLVAAGIVSALSGLWMTHYYSFPDHLQGNLLYFIRIFVGLSMTAYILLGLSAVLKKRIAQHQAWMIRAYALGQGAGTQVLITIPWLMTVVEPSGLTRDILMTVAWVINRYEPQQPNKTIKVDWRAASQL